MPRLIAQGQQPGQQKKFDLVEGETVLLGKRSEKSQWVVDWDPFIHGCHVKLAWRNDELDVSKVEGARNPVFFHGKETKGCKVRANDKFVIGNTTFVVSLDPTEPASASDVVSRGPVDEFTCRWDELAALPFTDADARLDILAALPEMIKKSCGDQELEARVLDALRRGIPRSTCSALVRLDARSTTQQPIVHVLSSSGKSVDKIKVSRTLVYNAVRRVRQAVLHNWSPDRQYEATTAADVDWAICTPLHDTSPGLALYVAGKLDLTALPFAASNREATQKSDLKFTSLVGDIFVSLRHVLHLRRRDTLLRSILSPNVIAALGEQDINDALKQRKAMVTVLFCDLRGFSRLTEESADDLEAICDRVNEALGIMTRNILDKDGVIGDFQGDAAMGFWGWPLPEVDQVEKAARTALAIRKEFLQCRQRPNHPLADFACGIGIAHGEAIAGKLGPLDQFKVSVFGPVVNLASRIEGLTKHFKTSILLDDAAAEELRRRDPSGKFTLRTVVRVQPQGMKRAVQLFELMPPGSDPDTLGVQDREDYQAGLEFFQTGDWSTARDLFERLPNDGPSQILLNYMSRTGSPPKDFDGTIVMTSKNFD